MDSLEPITIFRFENCLEISKHYTIFALNISKNSYKMNFISSWLTIFSMMNFEFLYPVRFR